MSKKQHTEDTFKITHLIRNKRDGSNNLLVIADKDMDGVISAIFLITKVKDDYDNIDIVFSHPYLSKHLRNFLTSNRRMNNYQAFAMVDISVDYVNPNATRELFNILSKKLVYVFDHHNGWFEMLTGEPTCSNIEKFYIEYNDEVLAKGTDNSIQRNIIISEELSCAKLIYDYLNLEELEDEYLNTALMLSLISDDLAFRKDSEGSIFYDIFTNFKGKNIEESLHHLLKREPLLAAATKQTDGWYTRNIDKADSMVKSMEEIYPGVGYVKAFSGNSINYTILCEQCYTKYKVIIIKELNAKEMKMSFVVATSLSHLDLTTVFNLNGGNPRRITINRRGVTIDSVLDTLKPYLA